jgi:hypothetical protein
MKPQLYFGIAFRIVLLFGLGMLWTFINPALRDFFGDTRVPIQTQGFFRDGWEWGARHYWYFWMMFMLFILSFVNSIMGIIKLFDKHYSND